MIARYAVIENELVTSVVLADLANLPASLQGKTLVEAPPHVSAGDSYVGGEFVIHVLTTEELIVVKRDETNLERERRFLSVTVTMNGWVFDGDPISANNITGILAANSAGIPVPWPLMWRGADNINRSVSQADMVTLAALIMQRIQTIYAESWYLKDTIIPAMAAAGTLASLNVADDAYWS